MVWEQYRRTSKLANAMMWSRRSIGVVKKVVGGNCCGNSCFLSSSAGDFWVGRNDEEIGDRNVDIFDRALKCKQVASQILSFFLVVASAWNPKGLGFKDDRGYEQYHHKSPKDGVWCNCCIEGIPSGIYFNYLIRYLLFLCNNRLRSGMMWHMFSRRKSSSNYDTLVMNFWC